MLPRLSRMARDAYHGRIAATDPRLVRVCLAIVVLLAFKVAAQIAVGPAWDSYSFLANAASFAGQGFGYTEPARPPLISLLVSLPMRLGATDASVIQVVDGLLTAVGLGALYLVLRRRFGRAVSAAGTMAFLISPPVWRWVGVGYTDIAAVAITLIALVFAIKATEDDQRWYLALFPTLLAAVLMRTTSVLFIGVVGVWLVLRAKPFRHAPNILSGIGVAILAYLPLGWYYVATVGHPLYPVVAGARVQEAAGASHLAGIERPVESFVRSMPQFAAPGPLTTVALALFAIAAVGLFMAALRAAVARRIRIRRVVAACVVVAVSAALVLGRGPAAVLIVAGACFAVWRLLGSDEHSAEGGSIRIVPAAWALDATMASWIIGLIAFHEQWAQRVERYYIAMAPAVIYLVALGLVAFVANARPFKRSDATTARIAVLAAALVPALVTALLLGGSAVDMLGTSWTRDRTVADAIRTASWLQERGVPKNATVYSDSWPQTSWYLRGPVKAMPTFDDRKAVSHELIKNSARYYVTARDAEGLGPYTVGMDTGATRVLVADALHAEGSPRVQYLGAGWENYVERLSGFGFFLEHDEGDYNMQGSAFLDAYPVERLRQARAVAVYGAQWHDRSRAERLMMEYVEEGGVLVIDASANLAQPFSLQDCVLFDTVVTRKTIPATARIQLDPTLVASNPDLRGFENADFATAEDPQWSGASYQALPGSEPLRVLARAGDTPVVAVREWGRGRVIWVGGNLIWHAQATGNADEAALARAIFDEALRPRTAEARLEDGIASKGL